MKPGGRKRVALVWAQYSAYHMDRCEAAARRLAGRADVTAVEVSTKSTTYEWEPSTEIRGARKITLFPGRAFETISRFARFWRLLRVLSRFDTVFMGIGYNELDAIALSWVLRLLRVRVVMMTASKFDDFPRTVWFEFCKAVVLSSYRAGVVGGRRQAAYLRFFGFRKREVVPGYNTVGLERVRRQSGAEPAPGGAAFEDRHFIYVGRFVAKKNLHNLIEAFAVYVGMAGESARRLTLVGAGAEEAALRRKIADLGIADRVDFPGFLPASEVSKALAGSLALLLVSTEEQWGLVVNEALAFGLPIVASFRVGACDALIRNLVNGFVVEPDSVEGMARAMASIAAGRDQWESMVKESHRLAWMGDAGRFADAVEVLLYPDAEPARGRVAEFRRQMDIA